MFERDGEKKIKNIAKEFIKEFYRKSYEFHDSWRSSTSRSK